MSKRKNIINQSMKTALQSMQTLQTKTLQSYQPPPPKPRCSQKLLADKLKLVRAAFDFAELKEICETPTDGFDAYTPKTFDPFDAIDGNDAMKWSDDAQWYHHIDNGSKILTVAHLDSVQSSRHTVYLPDSAVGPIVYSPVLDDRLGVYTILKLLPKLGYSFDVLLCMDEEQGMSSAELFEPDKENKYNWMVEFDRKGDDVCLYDYESKNLREMLEYCRFRIGQGSYTDICRLTHLGCRGFNVGVGYDNYHEKSAHALLDQYFMGVARFMVFHEIYGDDYLEYTKRERSSSYGTGRGLTDDDWNYATGCLECAGQTKTGQLYCPSCASFMSVLDDEDAAKNQSWAEADGYTRRTPNLGGL